MNQAFRLNSSSPVPVTGSGFLRFHVKRGMEIFGGIWTRVILRRTTLPAKGSQKRFCSSRIMTSVVKEGKAEILQPKSVFYNPVQEFNRDITIAVISDFVKDHFTEVQEKLKKRRERNNQNDNLSVRDETSDQQEEGSDELEINELKPGVKYKNGIRILEGLSASGLRSVRFGLELSGIKQIIANDVDQKAVEIIKHNIVTNKLEHLVSASHCDASLLMYQSKNFADRFDVVDLDPYGTASPFLDAGVQAVRDGGLLCVTCTDLAILCGNASETCFAKYGAMSLRTKYCHEMALRIVLQSIAAHASRYSRYIVPVLCLSVDFYVRLFVKVYTGPRKVKDMASKLALVYHCTGCGSFNLQRLGQKTEKKENTFKFSPATGPPVSENCAHCQYKHQLGGPIYAEMMHDRQTVERILKLVEDSPDNFKTSDKIIGMLNVVSEELPDVALNYDTDELCKVMHCNPPTKIAFRSAVLNAGYKVSMSHTNKNSLQTDAPASVIWDIMKAWIKLNPMADKRKQEHSAGIAILEKESSIQVSFENHPEANPKSRSLRLKRFCPNPEKNWGPKPRARRADDGETMEARREKNQGKRKRQELGDHTGETETRADDQSMEISSSESNTQSKEN